MNAPPTTSRTNGLQNATDAELLMRFVRARDERCFEAIVERYSELVYRVCRTVLLNPADAEDAYQTTFLILVRKAKCLLAVQSLGGWLYKVAYRLSVRSNLGNRKKNHGQLESDPESEIDQFHLISRKEVLSGVFEEMSRLPTKYQEVLVECYLQGKSYREVAEQTDSTETIIKGRVAQAKKTLRRKLLKRGIALSFVLVMLEQVRSQAVAGSLPPVAWTESVRGLLSQSGSNVTTAIKSFSHYGIQRMSLQLLTKPLTLIVFAFVATCVPVMWLLNQPILGQDSGISLQESGSESRDAAEVKVQEADPFGESKPRRKSGKGGAPRPRIQDPKDPFGAGPSKPARSKANVDLDPFGGSDFGNRSASSRDPFGGGSPANPFGSGDKAAPKSKPKPRKASPFETGVAAEAKIDQALTKPSNFDFVDTPLVDVAEQLSDDYRIAVHVDKVAIEDAGLDPETPMTGQAKNRTLRSSLHFLFKENEFTFLIKNETLIITTEDAIANDPDDYLVSKLYDVTKLASKDSESVVNTVQQGIDKQSWSDNDGYAAMNVLKLGNRTVLAITHTSEHHYRIQQLLQSLEKMNAN